MDRYHRGTNKLISEFRERFTEESINKFLLKLRTQDEKRLEGVLSELQQQSDLDESTLVVVLFELLNYPDSLDNKRVNQLFSEVIRNSNRNNNTILTIIE